jgi:hypothetical protein
MVTQCHRYSLLLEQLARQVYTKVIGARVSQNRNEASGPLGQKQIKGDVRFTPESGHVQCTSSCLLWANSGHLALFDYLVGAGEQAWRDS